VRPPGLVVPAEQDFIVRFQEQHGYVDALFNELLVHAWEQTEELARANIDDECRPVDLAGIITKLDEGRDELNGEVVYCKVSEIFKILERRRYPRPRHSGDDNDGNRHKKTRRQKAEGSI
jgi:hypothetical protein